jgi:hypothetical protein
MKKRLFQIKKLNDSGMTAMKYAECIDLITIIQKVD